MAPRTLATLSGLVILALVPARSSATELVSQVGPYELQVLVDGLPAPAFFYGGQTYILGQRGQRYTLRVVNRSGRRVEVVASVDGRDVIDGKAADFVNKRGYLVAPWGQVDIDGWRISTFEAAAFRFSSVADSYAARTGSGRDVGVIGVAVFPEREILRRTYSPSPVRPAPWCCEERTRSESADKAAPAPGAAQSAPSSPLADRAVAPSRRHGLGTELGEAVPSLVETVELVRANQAHPSAVLGVRYDDREGLLAMGIPVDGWLEVNDAQWRRTAEPFPVVDRGFVTPPPGWKR